MAIAVVFPFAGQRVIEVAAGQRDVGSEQPDNLGKLGIERPSRTDQPSRACSRV